MTKLLVNASNVTSPGAVILARNLISVFVRCGNALELSVVSVEGVDLVDPSIRDKVNEIKIKRSRLYWLQRIWFEFRSIRSIVKREKPDVMLSLGNVAPANVGIPVVVLLQQSLIAGGFYSLSKFSIQYWNVYYHRKLFNKTVSNNTVIVTQINCMKDAVCENYSILDSRVKVIPNGVSDRIIQSSIENNESETSDQKPVNKITLVYPSAFYVYKNHKLLLEVARKVKLDRSEDVKFVITANERDKRAREILGKITEYELGDVVENIGMVDERRLAELYSESSALFFPSLAESFGNPLLEAAAFGLPVLAADLPYAHDVMGDAALYFDPHDPVSALNAIKTLADPDVRADLSQRSKRRFEESPSWEEIASQYLDVILEAANKEKPHS